MKTRRNEKCPCGSGKKYKRCCLIKNTSEVEPVQCTNQEPKDYTGVTVYHGFTKKHENLGPFDIDFENACCFVVQANKTVADEQNEKLQFKMLQPGDWFVMAEFKGQTQFSYKYKSAEAAMDVAKEKFDAVKFLTIPDFI